MAYAPDTITITSWSSPVTIVGTDMIRNLDEAVNQIVTTDTNSFKNHVNTELAKIPPYMTSEFNKIYDGVEEQATIATDKATIATTKASEASASATTATTKASEASTSASEALASKNTAVTSATTATTQAGIATTKAGEASDSAISADASADIAVASKDTAVTKAGEASTSATQALTYRNEAEGFRDEAEGFASSIDPSNIVHKTGDETIAGIKTFSSSPIVPTPTTATQASNKSYVDALPLSGTIQGIKVGNTTIADATTLDWYEEGTFTPTIVGVTTAGVTTYVSQLGNYTRVGNQVTCRMFLEWSAFTGTGGMKFGGLPFAPSVSANTTIHVQNMTFTVSPIWANPLDGILKTVSSGASDVNLAVDTSAKFDVVFTYFV